MFSLHPGFLIILQSEKVFLPSILKKTHTPLVFSITDLGRRSAAGLDTIKYNPKLAKLEGARSIQNFLFEKLCSEHRATHTHTHTKKRKAQSFFFGWPAVLLKTIQVGKHV